MSLKDCKRKKERIFKEIEADSGFTLLSDVRTIIENDVGDCGDYGGDPEGERDYLENFSSVAKRYGTAIYLTLRKTNSPKINNSKSSKPRKVYWGTLERRVHLIDFVIEKKARITACANWKQLTAEWNKEHNHNQKNLNVLKADYHRALKDDNVTARWISWRVAPIFCSALKKVAEKMKKLDLSILEKHGIKNLNDFERLEDMGVTLDNLLEAQEKETLSEYLESEGWKREVT